MRQLLSPEEISARLYCRWSLYEEENDKYVQSLKYARQPDFPQRKLNQILSRFKISKL
jgi:hypothetical protein